MTTAPLTPEHLDVEFARGLLLPGGITSVFQPLVRIGDGRVVGYEALSRATADLRRAPDQWLAEAEQLGMRVDVELACLRAAAACGAPPDGALLFVNVSHTTMLDPRFDAVRASLPVHVLEITEHEPVEDYAGLHDRMKPWLAEGTLLAIDDVGAGYASMAHVLKLSPAFVKIDRSMVSGIENSRQQRLLVEALVAFAGGMRATTVGEGVETAAELDVLRDLGVDIAQGWLIARPGAPWVPAADTAPLHRSAGADDLEGLRALVARTTQAQDAADVVTRFLARQGHLLPSVYTARSDVLRCLSRKGQWLVQDGMPSGVGITGACFSLQSEIFVEDVVGDARYRAAVPGVVQELAVPLRVDGEVLGVLNVDATAPITAEDATCIREAAAILAARLSSVGLHARRNSALLELGRRAPWVAAGASPVEVSERTVEAALAVTDLTSAAVWVKREDGSGYERLAHLGPELDVLATLTGSEVQALNDLAADFTSCYSGGGVLDLGFGPTQTLRERGAYAMLLAPLRDGGRQVGLLAAVSPVAANVGADSVEAVELLCLHTGSRLAALSRLQQLEGMVYRDALTGVANRTRWDELLDGHRTAPSAIGWLVSVDIDRFKRINDNRGHVAGDQALRAVAAELARFPLEPDLVIRTGGDEFVLLLPPGSAEGTAELVGDVQRRAADALAPFDANVSFGASRVPAGPRGLHDAFAAADRALYLAKARGGAVAFASAADELLVPPQPVTSRLEPLHS